MQVLLETIPDVPNSTSPPEPSGPQSGVDADYHSRAPHSERYGEDEGDRSFKDQSRSQGSKARPPINERLVSAVRGIRGPERAVKGGNNYDNYGATNQVGDQWNRKNRVFQAKRSAIVMVMGCTGAGKSSLFSLCGATGFKRGHTLNSETREPDTWNCVFDGTNLTLVDTPGFGDTKNSDTQTLASIVDWLMKSYEKGDRIRGIIYMHRITDNRMSGEASQSLQMLEQLCGGTFMKNVIFCTSFWDVVDKGTGHKRENELRRDFWNRMIDKGADVTRHMNTRESAEAVLRQAINKKGGELRIQKQLNDGMLLCQTSAGKIVQTDVERLELDYKQKMEKLEAALSDKDQLVVQFVQEEKRKMLVQIAELEEDKRRLTSFLARSPFNQGWVDGITQNRVWQMASGPCRKVSNFFGSNMESDFSDSDCSSIG